MTMLQKINKANNRRTIRGSGILNSIINNLPLELHIPGYQYCGPGTNLKKRLSRGDRGVNLLDSACKTHDIAYASSSDLPKRHMADKVLKDKAWGRLLSSDASIGKKAALFAVANAMGAKIKLGMGFNTLCKQQKKRKALPLSAIISAAKLAMKNSPMASDPSRALNAILNAAKTRVHTVGGKKQIRIPRVIPVPTKSGGFLPLLIPFLAGISAIGSLAGGTAGIIKTVNAASAAKKQLEENKRHNKNMEDIAIGKGLYLAPYKKGFGLLLKSSNINKRKQKNL